MSTNKRSGCFTYSLRSGAMWDAKCSARLALQKHLAVWRIFQALVYELCRFIIVPTRLVIHLLHADDTQLPWRMPSCSNRA